MQKRVEEIYRCQKILENNAESVSQDIAVEIIWNKYVDVPKAIVELFSRKKWLK